MIQDNAHDMFLSVASPVQHEIKVRGSRFIGWVSPSADAEDAERLVAEKKVQYHDATHNCYAYRIGTGDSARFRYHDDGEPSGTAGKPIYDVLEGRGLTQVICVVTRYFGGTKLGPGGLARAYGQCASETADRAKAVRHVIRDRLTLRFGFNQMGRVMTLLSRFRCQTLDTAYHPDPVLTVAVRQSQRGMLCRMLIDETAGAIQIDSVRK